MNTHLEFCVLMSVYEQDDDNHLQEALNSLLEQTYKASEVIVIGDGPLKSSQISLISSFSKGLNIRFIPLEKNKGLANALKIGVELTDYEWIARMDSDDICYPDRFEKQINYLKRNEDVDVVGGNITEFVVKKKTISERLVREHHEDIVNSSKFLSPMNHVTVMFRRSAVLHAGNYNDKYTMMEDYPLWMALIGSGAKFYNIQEPLVAVRVEGLSSRRKGFKYAKTEASMFYYFYKSGFIKLHHLFINMMIRFPIRTIASPLIKYAYLITRGRNKND